LKDINLLVRLWYHECCRIFQDRLVNDEDRNWFAGLLRSKIKSDFDVEPRVALGTQMLFFADFIDPTTDFREYEEIKDATKVPLIFYTIAHFKIAQLSKKCQLYSTHTVAT
jgi:dynein heavy chain